MACGSAEPLTPIECAHLFETEEVSTEVGGGNWAQSTNGRGEYQGPVQDFQEPIAGKQTRGECRRCGAWLGCLGLEPTMELFIRNTVLVFREVMRVLRDDGVLWLNMGDSYAGSWGSYGHRGQGTQRPIVKGSSCDNHAYDGQDGFRPSTATPPTGLKPKDLCGIPWRVAFALQADGWYLRSACPWVKRCLSGGTWLYVRSQKGDMPMMLKDAARLPPETIKLWNGERWTQVKGFFKTEPPPEERKAALAARKAAKRNGSIEPIRFFEIELRSGERIGCTADHIWPTESGNKRADELHLGDVIRRCKLPEPESPDSPSALDDSEIGWLVGLFLAEGGREDRTLKFSGHKCETPERLKKLEAIAAKFHGTASFCDGSGEASYVSVYGAIPKAIVDAYIFGDSPKTKCLYPKCWRRSDAFLRAVLDGYLEGDGHYDEKNDRWRLGFCNNDNLARDLRTLGARLGVSVRIKRATAIDQTGKRHKAWRGSVRLNERPAAPPGGFSVKSDGEVIAIRASRARTYWDVEVEDDPHLFAMSSGCLTHNSAMPESVRDRPATALEYVFLFSKSKQYFYDHHAVRKGSGDRSRARRNTDWWFESLAAPHGMVASAGGEVVGFDVNPEPSKEKHYATFPPKLIQPMIAAGTSEYGCCRRCRAPFTRVFEQREQVGDWCDKQVRMEKGHNKSKSPTGDDFYEQFIPEKPIGWEPTCECKQSKREDGSYKTDDCIVLDPFGGTATTVLVAKNMGRRAVAIEINKDYVLRAERRVRRRPAPFKQCESLPGQRGLFEDMDNLTPGKDESSVKARTDGGDPVGGAASAEVR